MIKQNKGEYNVVQMDLAKSSEVIIKISQPISMKNSPAKLRFVVNQDIEENKEFDERLYYITGLFEKDEQLSFIESEDAYSKGTYYLFIEFDDVEIDYCLTIISNCDAKITIMESPQSFLEEMVRSYMSIMHTSYRSLPSEPDIHIKSYFGLKLGGYGCHAYVNNSKNDTMYLENFKYKNPDAVKCLFKSTVKDDFHEVLVKPDSQKYLICKKLNPESEVDVFYSNAFIHSDESLIAKCLEKGNVKVVKDKSGNDTKIKLHIDQSDSGYVFCFVNSETENRLDAYVSFPTLTNLDPEEYKFDKDSGEKCWHIVVDPGQTLTRFVRRQDFRMKFVIAYKSSFKILGKGESPRKL